MTNAEEQSANLIVDRFIAERDRLRQEIDRLRGLLKPLARVAMDIDEHEDIDGHPGGKLRPDSATIWQANAYNSGPNDLTMGHARAARKALEEG